MEKDPNGLDQHAGGAKLDDGKVRVELVLKGFANALWCVCEVGTYGAVKYTPDGWLEVPNGVERYGDARGRHMLQDWMGEDSDSGSLMLHAAHDAWNSLARLELLLRSGKRRIHFNAVMNKLRADLDAKKQPSKEPQKETALHVVMLGPFASSLGNKFYVRRNEKGSFEWAYENEPDMWCPFRRSDNINAEWYPAVERAFGFEGITIP